MKNENLKSAITCDLDGKVLSFSRGAENIFGYKSKDVVGKMRVSDFSDGEVQANMCLGRRDEERTCAVESYCGCGGAEG